MQLAFLAGGIDAPGYFLRDMTFDYYLVCLYDTASCLRAPLAEMHSATPACNFCLGPVDGDILLADYKSWPRLDGLVAGPPCPPWSAIGKRKSCDDERAGVFEQVTKIIIDQYQKGMAFWIIEMVLGQTFIDPSTGKSYYDAWLQEISRECPACLISCFRLDSRDYWLPQHRERIYTVGIHMRYSSTPVPRPLPLPKVSVQSLWQELLHPGLPPNREHHLTRRQGWNLAVVKAMTARSGKWTNPISVEVDRDPTLQFGALIRTKDGCTSTLRTGNELIWLCNLESDSSLSMSRCLHPLERFGIQGFDCSFFAQHLSKEAWLIGYKSNLVERLWI